MKVICISGKAGHGKDTVANIINSALSFIDKKVLVCHFADLVKYTCATFFGWNGKKDEAGRTLLQYVGTDKVRAKNPDFWVSYIASVLKFFDGEWDCVVIPDCRFTNEYELLKECGFDVELWRVVRPDFDNGLTDKQKNHPSETELDDYNYDAVIENNGSEDELITKVVDIISTKFCNPYIRSLRYDSHA